MKIVNKILHGLIAFILGFLIGLMFTPEGITLVIQRIEAYENGDNVVWPEKLYEPNK